MPTPTCPECGRVIPSDDVNVANDVAYCRACNLSHKLSTLTQIGELESGVDLNRPPAGAWRREAGVETVIGATHRAVGTAIGALAICLFWNGIVSIFVLLVTASTLRHLGITLPDWFPAPDLNGRPMSVGMMLFMWIFLTPFIVVGLIMLGAFLSALGGRTEVRISGSQGVVYTGIGALGWRRRFDPATVKDVRVEDRSWRDSDGDRRSKTSLVIETREGKLIRFGAMLKDERRKFVAVALRKGLLR